MSFTIKNLRETTDSAPKFGLSEMGESRFVREEPVRVAPSVRRAFEAGPEGLSLLVFGPHYEKDGEVLNDFWQD